MININNNNKENTLRENKQTSASTPKVSTGCEEHIQLQQQWPQEMISVKTVPTTIKLC